MYCSLLHLERSQINISNNRLQNTQSNKPYESYNKVNIKCIVKEG